MHQLVNLVLGLPVLVSAAVFIALVIALSLGSYFLTRRIWGTDVVEETRELAGSVLFRIAALHGLVLALVFAQELSSIRTISDTAAHEAAMVADIYYDLERYDSEQATAVRADLAAYAIRVLEEEWMLLAREQTLSDGAWQAWERSYEGLLDLEPESGRQTRLLNIMIDDIRELSELREAREDASHGGASGLFLIAAIAGIVLISAAYFTFPPSRINLVLMSSFSAYTGLIIYFVVAYANPYHAPGNAEPTGFVRFVTEEVRTRAASGAD